MSSQYVVYLQSSRAKGKKYTVVVFRAGRKLKTIHFGSAGMSDYTINKDPERMNRYIDRHKKRENWDISGILTAGFWSRWLLWSEPSLSAAIDRIAQKFNIKIYQAPPPAGKI